MTENPVISKHNIFEMHDSSESVTHKVYFDINIEGEDAGRIVIGLFDHVSHLAVKNFRHICGGYDLRQK